MKSRWPILLLGLLVLIFFSPYLSRSQGFLFGDNFSQRIPTLTFWKEEVANGRLPLWNPFILGGIPFFADLSNNALAPTNFVYLLLPVPVALTLLVLFFIYLSCFFTYLFVRTLTHKEIPSIFSAVAFAFSGTVIASVNDINSLQGIAFIPAVFFLAQRWLQSKKPINTFLLLFGLTLQFVSSHPQYPYYTWMVLAPYMLVFAKGSLMKKLSEVAVIFTLFFLLVAVQLLPFLELSDQVFRPGTPEFSTQNALQIKEFPRLVLANFYGSWQKGSSWGPGSQLETGLANTEGYMGVLPLLLAAAAIFTRRTKQTRFWAAAAILAFFLSLGSATPLHEIARRLLPLFVKFRSPVRLLSIYSFSIAILAGLAIGALERNKK